MSVITLRRLVIAACISVCGLMPATASAASSRTDATEASIVHAMNRYRAQHGLPRLVTSRPLQRAADAHSASMLRSNVLAHGAFAARMRHYAHARSAGENLAWMSSCDAKAIVDMWAHSAAHRAVMLTSSFRRVGVARRSSSSGCFVTADFATTR
jgi:uncharacterized protein YkwD